MCTDSRLSILRDVSLETIAIDSPTWQINQEAGNLEVPLHVQVTMSFRGRKSVGKFTNKDTISPSGYERLSHTPRENFFEGGGGYRKPAEQKATAKLHNRGLVTNKIFHCNGLLVLFFTFQNLKSTYHFSLLRVVSNYYLVFIHQDVRLDNQFL